MKRSVPWPYFFLLPRSEMSPNHAYRHLWLQGAVGSGKSSIARSIAEWCYEEKRPLALFFFASEIGNVTQPCVSPSMAPRCCRFWQIFHSQINCGMVL